jgi:hypothetical protein
MQRFNNNWCCNILVLGDDACTSFNGKHMACSISIQILHFLFIAFRHLHLKIFILIELPEVWLTAPTMANHNLWNYYLVKISVEIYMWMNTHDKDHGSLCFLNLILTCIGGILFQHIGINICKCWKNLTHFISYNFKFWFMLIYGMQEEENKQFIIMYMIFLLRTSHTPNCETKWKLWPLCWVNHYVPKN